MRNFFSRRSAGVLGPQDDLELALPGQFAGDPAGGRVNGQSLGQTRHGELIGRSPVAGMVYRNGDPGRTPNTAGPLIRGSGGAGGVRIFAELSAAKADRQKASIPIPIAGVFIMRRPLHKWNLTVSSYTSGYRAPPPR